MDHSNIIQRSARKSRLKINNPTIHGRIRLVLGAFKSSPIESLNAEADETKLRWKK